uniref:Uncharacterized protein n=2 Tax=Tetraodon nigroviridis TaxID=99883 RepID=H3DQX0_TETNG
MGSDIVGCRDAKGRTPLHAAAFAGHVDCIHLLLSHDAPVDAVDQSGFTPLMMAAEKGRDGALEVLLTSSSANLGLTDKDGNTALHLACSSGKESCVMLILDRLTDGALLNTTNAALQTPLHLADRSGLKRAVEELLSRGASAQRADENGRSPEAQLVQPLICLEAWLPLATPGYPWLPLATPGYPWLPLANPGYPWLPLATPGYPWLPLANPG